MTEFHSALNIPPPLEQALPSGKRKSPLPAVPDHILINSIGCGSYGEVWLARCALGHYRAVKIVWRDRFERDGPFEREFRGIQRFEPVSRTHEGLLDVLHVGRNDDLGYFYYVMELADDAEQRSDGVMEHPSDATKSETQHFNTPSLQDCNSYIPRTLRHELRQRGRLQVAECVRIGLALGAALEHLHQHGLIHRDLKPSNIIFVGGVPKLADIGLVAGVDEAHSVVGTLGFIPPEGPGTPQADLFSLGKVLYEISTGKDRQEFPQLPPNLREFSPQEQEALGELNEVLLKACENDFRQRYQSAAELRADLALLQGGRSVRRLRRIERRLTVLTRAGLAAAGLAALAAGLYWSALRESRAVARQLYVAEMNLAAQAWESGNLRRARQLLEKHRDRQPEHLGFEWRLLWHLSQQSEARSTFSGHTGRVWSAAFSPDGKTLATAGADRTVKLWDTVRERLITALTNHQDSVHAVAFSPTGQILASGGRDKTIQLWDVQSHACVARLEGHSDAVRAVLFTADGHGLVSGGEDGTIRLWNVAEGTQVDLLPHGIRVDRLALSPDGKTLAGCGYDSQARLWDLATRQKLRDLGNHRAYLIDAAFSPDGLLLATGGYDGTAKLWDLSTGRERASLGRGAPVRCVMFSPEGDALATAADDTLIRLWHADTLRPLRTFRGHVANLNTLVFAPDSRRLASGGDDGLVKLWETEPRSWAKELLQHEGMVNAIAFSPDTARLVAVNPNEDTLRLWNTTSGQLLASRLSDAGAVLSLAFTTDGETIITGGVDGTVRLWSSSLQGERARIQAHSQAIEGLAISPDGGLFATGSRDGSAKLWDLASRCELVSLNGGRVRAVAFSPDQQLLATGGDDPAVRLWRVGSRQSVAVLTGHEAQVRALAFSRDGQTLASGSADRTIRLWDVRTHKLRAKLDGHAAAVSSLAFAPEGRTLVSGSWDSTVKFWNLIVMQEVATLQAHSGQVTQVAFSPDGNILASASADSTVRMWRIPR